MGSGSHLGSLAFNTATGAKYQLVPYRGTGPAIQDLIANQIQIMVDQTSNSLPQAQAGKVKAYAITAQGALEGRARHSDRAPRPASPAWSFDLARPVGAQGHAGRHRGQAERRRRRDAATIPPCASAWRNWARTCRPPDELTPANFAAFHRAEFAKWKTILDAAGVKVEWTGAFRDRVATTRPENALAGPHRTGL